MGQLGRAIIVIAAAFIFVSPCAAAKIIKFEIVRVESPAFEARTFGAVGTYDRILARATMSMAERYPNRGDRAAAIAKATQPLVRDRLVLEEDAGLFVAKSN